MNDNLVGYLLNALDSQTQREVEEYLRTDPEAQKQLDLLRKSLRPLETDRDRIDPPPGLADRTLVRVRKRTREIIPMPAAPAMPRAPVSSWWHRGDVLVAAGLLICVVGLGAPGLYRLRASYLSRAECANNMRGMHQTFASYADTHNGNLPQVEEKPRRNLAGIFVPTVNESGVAARQMNVRCPSNGRPSIPSLTLAELDALSAEEFEQHAQRLGGCYAYTLGYRDKQNGLHGYRSDDHSDIPILADRPATDGGGIRGNSPNHNGGQNVLYIGGYVRFVKQPEAGLESDHIYLNRLNRVAAGVDRDDTVLGASMDRP